MTTLIAVSAIRRFSIDAAAVLRSVAAVVGLAMATAACSGTDAINQAGQPFEAGSGNVLMAMATGKAIDPQEVVEEEILEEQRGGFLTVGGLQVNFGFEFTTMVNGTPQLTSVLTLNDIVSGNGVVPSLNNISISGADGGITEIIHAAGPDGISATILNSQNGIDIENISTLAIDIIGLRNVHKGGRALGNGRRMPMEMQQALIRGLSR
ncbi:hypothetical protein [Pelagibius sp.]|uniref:hypothetical protein n=1 Tax=Pelagibius sp. TaxID=1931238 RepID=UPI0026282BFF|nr:hypothetical protein [Pelagibius sp.]